MRATNDTNFIKGVARVGIKALPMAIMLASMAPMQAMAVGEEVCNSKIFVSGVEGPEFFFVGDELLLKADIGAGLIRDNDRPGAPNGEEPYIDFTGIGYGLDCGGGSSEAGVGCYPTGYPDYPPENRGHDLEFIGVTDSDCPTSEPGIVAEWPTPEADNIVSIPVLNGVVRQEYKVKEGKGETCSVDMKFRVNALHESTNWVVQSLGVPYYAGDGPEDDMVGRCSNGLLATEYGNTVFYVNTCEIEVDKQVSLDGQTWSDAASAFDGDDVYYRIVLSNVGTAPLIGDVIVNDEILGVKDVTVDAQGLKPGTSMFIDGGLVKNFDSKAACETANSLTNTAGVEAVCRVGTDEYKAVTDSKTDTAELSCAPRPPSIELVKSADPLVYSSLQETINYSFLVTNNGSVPLTDVSVSDPLPGLSTIDCPQAQLSVSEAMTCTATYSISQADLDAKVVNNTATAYGTAPDTSKVSDQSSAQITTTPRYSLALVKTADPLFYEAVGEMISYDYELTNSGNQTLYAPYGVLDDKTTVVCPATPVSLPPGASVSCSASYEILPGDITARSVTNVATGSAMNAASGGTSVFSNEDDETVVYKGIELSATDICVNDAPWAYYSFDVFGIPGYAPGDVTYTWVNVDDPNNEIVVGGPSAFPATSGYLLWPGAKVSPNVIPVTAPTGPADPTWPVPTAWPGWELVNGVWIESDVPETPQLVLRVSINPTDEVVVDYPPATPFCVAAPEALITVEKSVESVTPVGAGSVDVEYKVTVTNSGAQKGTYDLIDTLMVDEAFTPASVQSQVAYVAGSENETTGDIKTPAAGDFVGGATLVTGEGLDVGMTESFTVTLRFSIDELLLSAEGSNCELEEGENGNTGFLNHVDVIVDSEIVDEAEACDEYPLAPSIEVLKEILAGEGDNQQWLAADDQGSAPVVKYPSGAVYRIKVTNTGIVDLIDVTLNDPELGLSGYLVNGGFLAAGASVTIYDDTDEDTDVLAPLEVCGEDEPGYYQNIAYVTANGGEGSDGSAANDDDDAWLRCVGTPAIEVKKYISIDNGLNYVDGTAGPVEAPSGALYKITVENTGQTDLVDVEVDDTLIQNGPIVVGDLAVGDMYTITDGVIDDTGDGSWEDLDIVRVCGTSGKFQNVADAIGTSAEYDEDTTDTDDAFLDCIGPPRISIIKEVSWTGVENDWHDANKVPFPTAVVDATAETAYYRIMVGNIGTVPLSNVLVNDVQLGISNYLVGTLNPGDTEVLDQGVLDALAVENRCSSTGEKTNTANAVGTSAAGETDQASDSATVDCIGEPAIQIVKEVSSDGGLSWSTDETAFAPADALWRISLKNIGNVDLVDVMVDDARFGIVDYAPVGIDGAGYLRMDETVVITDGDLPELDEATACEGVAEITNVASVDGKASDSTKTVNGTASATLNCQVPVDICGPDLIRPATLKVAYNGTPDGVNVQNAVGVPPDADYSDVVTVRITDGGTKIPPHDFPAVIGAPIVIDGSYNGQGNSGKIPPNIQVDFLNGNGVIKQTISFHGSCSLPIYVGDEYAGITVLGYTSQ